jgi:hypothetical protein
MKRMLKILAQLYPTAWRNRYGAEYEALLDDATPRTRDAFDVFLGALKMQITTWSLVRITLATCLFGILAALALSCSLPPRYVAQTVITVYRGNASGLVPTSPEEITDELRGMTDAVLSTDDLSPLIQKYNLYPKERATMPLDAVLNQMRHNIDILRLRPGAHSNAAGGFALQFRYADPHTAQSVDSELTSLFMTGNLRSKEAAASDQLQSGLLRVQPQSGLVFVVNDPPALPQKPSFPNRRLFGASGLLAGLTGGLMLAAIARARRNRTAANS